MHAYMPHDPPRVSCTCHICAYAPYGHAACACPKCPVPFRGKPVNMRGLHTDHCNASFLVVALSAMPVSASLWNFLLGQKAVPIMNLKKNDKKDLVLPL